MLRCLLFSLTFVELNLVWELKWALKIIIVNEPQHRDDTNLNAIPFEFDCLCIYVFR